MSRLHGTKDFWIAALRADGPAFHAVLTEASLDTPVLSCPDWTLHDLARHLGAAYGWVRAFVVRGVTDQPAPPAAAPDVAAESLPQWWREEYDALLATLDAVDPELPAWNWAPQPKKAAFWLRRVAHETAVHRWDAQMAVAAGEPVEAKLATDGVAEVLDTWLPAGRRLVADPGQGVVQLLATDAAHEWFIRLRGAGVALLDTDTILDSDDHHARASASGTASDVLLALWGRLGFDALDVSGDARLLRGLRVGPVRH